MKIANLFNAGIFINIDDKFHMIYKSNGLYIIKHCYSPPISVQFKTIHELYTYFIEHLELTNRNRIYLYITLLQLL